MLRERLLVGPKGSGPKLAEYSGRGPLGTWLRAVAVRLALNELESRPRETPVEPELWEHFPASSNGGAELQLLRQSFKEHFRSAFAAAFETLSAEERNLLRLHLLDDVNIDKLAVLIGAHRATAARRIARAKEQLVEETRRVLSKKLVAPGSEVDELFNLVRSQLDVSIRRHLLEAVK
jgi:RNA polymerase sigma-70 factor (ECF subfamily)